MNGVCERRKNLYFYQIIRLQLFETLLKAITIIIMKKKHLI